jgi:hypothetical protein
MCRADKVYEVHEPGLRGLLTTVAANVEAEMGLGAAAHSGPRAREAKAMHTLRVVDVDDVIPLCDDRLSVISTILSVVQRVPMVMPTGFHNTLPLSNVIAAYLMRVWLEPLSVYKHPLGEGEAHPTLVIHAHTPAIDFGELDLDTLPGEIRQALQGMSVFCRAEEGEEIPEDMIMPPS